MHVTNTSIAAASSFCL